MIEIGTYFNQKSYILDSNIMRVELISSGARMVSLLDKSKGQERLLQSKAGSFVPRVYGSLMPECDPCGFDEMFPTIDPCCCEHSPWKGIPMPDHGEVWPLDWSVQEEKDALIMSTHGVRFPYVLSKKLEFVADHILRISYRLENKSAFRFWYLWAAHPMLNISYGTKMLLPYECKSVYEIVGERSYGDVVPIDEIKGIERSKNELAYTFRKDEKGGQEKYYVKERLKNGFAAFCYPDGGMLAFGFDTIKTPYLAWCLNKNEDDLWNIIEPATAPYDRVDIADRYGLIEPLEAYGLMDWHLDIKVG